MSRLGRWFFSKDINKICTPPIIFRNEKMAPLFNLTTVYRLNIYPNPGTPEQGRQEGQLPLLPFTRKGKGGGAKVPFQFKGLPWRNSELSEMLVQFFYEFASENARNAVIELQE
jgi:hypothetical protein